MGQPSASSSPLLSSSPLHWDGKCQNCRKLMSRCICFHESEGDVDPLHSAAAQVITDASETRPLWNALRKMHRKSAAPRLTLVQPPTSSRPSTAGSKEHRRKHSEALPSLSGHHAHRRSDARPPQSSRRPSREPRREPSPERLSVSRKDRLQRAGFTGSSHNLKKVVEDSGAMRSVQSTNSMGKHRTSSATRPKEKFHYEPEDGSDDEENVWEL
ncbi:hypothetical protein PRNP1_012343 [Phytophthora ramorum]